MTTSPSVKKAIYFAHPTNTYDTPLESAVMSLIRASLPDYEIESPNQLHHQKAYEQWQKETAENRDVHDAMQYFFKVVQPRCIGCISLPFLDGKLGLGVAGETARDADDGKPTWFIEPITNVGITANDLDAFVQNPRNGLFVIRSFTDDENKQIRHEVTEHQARISTGEVYEGASLTLSHQETRLRSFYVYQGAQRPYAEAHLVSMPIPDGFYSDEK